MPKDNIERAIAKGTGEGVDADQFETVLYEGYGPGGVALLIEALTDNRNRTGADVRHLLGKHGGSLGEPGSVSYLFDKQGVIVVDAGRYDEDDLMPAIDAGALDIVRDDDVFEVVTEPADLTAVRDALTNPGCELGERRHRQRPKVRVPVEEADAARLMKLIDALEDSTTSARSTRTSTSTPTCSSGSPAKTGLTHGEPRPRTLIATLPPRCTQPTLISEPRPAGRRRPRRLRQLHRARACRPRPPAGPPRRAATAAPTTRRAPPRRRHPDDCTPKPPSRCPRSRRSPRRAARRPDSWSSRT